MKTETREVYKCEYCNKMYQKKSACIKHEEVCFKRPDHIRPCHSCINLEKRETEVSHCYSHGDDWDRTRTVELLYCKKKDCFIHPHRVAVKGNAFKTEEKENIEMPKDCELFEDVLEYELKNTQSA